MRENPALYRLYIPMNIGSSLKDIRPSRETLRKYLSTLVAAVFLYLRRDRLPRMSLPAVFQEILHAALDVLPRGAVGEEIPRTAHVALALMIVDELRDRRVDHAPAGLPCRP